MRDIKISAKDKVIYTSLNPVDDMPKSFTVMAIVNGIAGFCDCFRSIDPERDGKEIFWLENECREVEKSEIVGWVYYPGIDLLDSK